MKVMLVNRHPGSPVTNPPVLSLYPSTAVIHAGQPFFLPDHCGRWEARLSIALRLCRLGKSIDEKFAGRYFDAMAPVIMFVPVDFEKQPQLSGLMTAIDSTLAIGPWQPLPEPGKTFDISVNGLDLKIGADDVKADATIATISRYCMLQMGDAVLPVVFPTSMPVGRDMSFTMSAGGSEPYEIRVK